MASDLDSAELWVLLQDPLQVPTGERCKAGGWDFSTLISIWRFYVRLCGLWEPRSPIGDWTLGPQQQKQGVLTTDCHVCFFFSFKLTLKTWNASKICISSLSRGHANLCIIPILEYLLPKQAQYAYFWVQESLKATHIIDCIFPFALTARKLSI